MNSIITANALSKSYLEGNSTRLILTDVSLAIMPGELVALLGDSGSGKSTLLHMLSGIDIPDQGEIYLNGQNIVEIGDNNRTKVRRKHMGFIFQFFNLINYLSAKENILLSLKMNDLDDQPNLTRVNEMITRLNIDHRQNAYPHELSGGEQQRVAIARALAHDPQLILADEPTGNLDAATSDLVMHIIQKEVHSSDRAALIVTHSMKVAKFCDRIFELKQGRLNEISIP